MTADLAVKWLLDAYQNLLKLKEDLVIVPVQINYDRVFEQGNLSQEMITGQQEEYSLYSTFQAILDAQTNSYGEAHVKYLDPIDIRQYLSEDLKLETLQPENIDSAALQLTEHLLRTQ